MASFEPIMRNDENAIRAPGKMQPKTGRKALGDLTNSRKPFAKDKASAKNFNGSKAQEKVLQPKATGRKPLGDLTNSNKPCAKEKLSKKTCCSEKVHSWAPEEGCLHNHNACIKAQRQSLAMSLDYFMETVALQKDSTHQLPQLSTTRKLEVKMPMEFEKLDIDTLDICCSPILSAPESPSTPKSPVSPCWIMDWNNVHFSPPKLNESPTRN